MDQSSILLPIVVGTGATICTILAHALTVIAVVLFMRRERRLGRVGAAFWADFMIVAIATHMALAAHLIEIGVWAALFAACGQFHSVGAAFYHSAANYTTLGSADVAMSRTWRLLEPLEAADGLLMFGLSTAMIFAIVQRLVLTRFQDLRA
jgi:hypothetical protein